MKSTALQALLVDFVTAGEGQAYQTPPGPSRFYARHPRSKSAERILDLISRPAPEDLRLHR